LREKMMRNSKKNKECYFIIIFFLYKLYKTRSKERFCDICGFVIFVVFVRV